MCMYVYICMYIYICMYVVLGPAAHAHEIQKGRTLEAVACPYALRLRDDTWSEPDRVCLGPCFSRVGPCMSLAGAREH